MVKREPPRSQEFIESSGDEEEEQEQPAPSKKSRAKDAGKPKKGAKRQKVESASDEDVKGNVKAESGSESASEDEEKARPASKKGKAKAEADADSTEKNPFELNDDGAFVDIGGRRRLTVSEFKGNLYVGLREYYEDKKTGQLMPGKKGISLNIETYGKVRDLFTSGVIDEQIAKMSSGKAKKAKK